MPPSVSTFRSAMEAFSSGKRVILVKHSQPVIESTFTGIISLPPTSNCRRSDCGKFGAPAVTTIALYGAKSSSP